MKVDPSMLIMARIADNTALSVYAQTKDARTGRNYPKSIVKALTEEEKTVSKKPRQYKTGEDFLRDWKRLTR